MTDVHYRAVDGLNSTPVSGAAPLPVTNGNTVYQLATNASLASAGTTAAVTGVPAGSYIWDVVGTFGSSSAVALQTLGSDGATWKTIGSAVTANSSVGVVIGANASVRLLGSVATTTALYSSLS